LLSWRLRYKLASQAGVMIKLFSSVFSFEIKIYKYNIPEKIIVERISSIFNKSGKFLSEPDFDGSFIDNHNFIMRVNSKAVTGGNAKFGSILIGKMKQLNGQVFIETKVKSVFLFKVIAIVLFLLGVAYLYKSINERSTEFFLWALVIILFASIACNWFASIANAIIRERFETYVDKEIKKLQE
jgi:hypothetical protein